MRTGVVTARIVARFGTVPHSFGGDTPECLVDSVDCRKLFFMGKVRNDESGVVTVADQEHWGIKVGPVIVGGSSERRPATRADHRRNLIIWGFTVFFIGTASPMAAFVLVILTAIYVAAYTAPTDPDERDNP